MSGAGHSVKNTAKNISLVLLCVLLAVLCAANWLVGLGVAQMPADSLLRRGYDALFGGAVGYELRSSGIAAAEPAQIALTVDGTLSAVQYSLPEIDAALEAVRPLWGEVLTGQKAFAETTKDELLKATAAGDCALLHYQGAPPLSSVAGWMGGKWEEDLGVQTLLYADGAERIFARAADGTLWAADAKCGDATKQAAQRAFRGLPCDLSGTAYAVYPETLLFQRESLSLETIQAAPLGLLEMQSDASLRTLLGAFGFTPYAHSYQEQGGAVEVFVAGVSTLRIHGDGLIQYMASGTTGTVLAYDEGETNGLAALDAQLDCARVVLDTAMRAVESGTRASLYAVRQEQGMVTLVFLQTYNGVPVLGENDFATFRFRDGVLLSAEVDLQRFETTDARRTVLPARQAAASADGTSRGLMVAYRAAGETYLPARYFLK